MAFVGLLYAVAAPIQQETDGQPIIYGKGQVVGGMMTAEISYTRNSNPLYADDRVKEEDNSITGGTDAPALYSAGDLRFDSRCEANQHTSLTVTAGSGQSAVSAKRRTR